MTAARVHRFGPPNVITLERIDVPEPQDQEVLLRVHAAGLGPWDISAPNARRAQQYRLSSDSFIVDVNSAQLARRADMLETKELVTSVGTVLPLAVACAAHAMRAG